MSAPVAFLRLILNANKSRVAGALALTSELMACLHLDATLPNSVNGASEQAPGKRLPGSKISFQLRIVRLLETWTCKTLEWGNGETETPFVVYYEFESASKACN